MPKLPQLITTASKPMTRDGEFIAMMALVMAVGALAVDMMLPALGNIARDLAVKNDNDRQLLVAVYLMASAPGALIFGPLADRFGRRPILFLILALFIIAGIATALSPNFEMMLAARAAQGFISAGFSVLATSIVRDRYNGDAMARIMSTVFIIFLVMPVFAPSFGQLLLYVVPWPWLFHVLSFTTVLLSIWIAVRLPETMPVERRIPIDGPSLVKTWRDVIFHRMGSSYMVANGLMMGGLFGFINSAQQLFEFHFRAAEIFPYVFAGIAGGMGLANYINSRIVERFGARRVSHTALLAYVAIAAAHWMLHDVMDGLWAFSILMTLTISMVGLSGSNFGSIAMQPFAHAAGAAAAFQSFGRMAIASVIGWGIGQLFDGTTGPITLGYFVCGLLSLIIVMWAEGGRLFQRRNPPGAPVTNLGYPPHR